MPSHRTQRQVPHSAEEMFDLVADVEKYPEFVPLCESLRVRRRQQEGPKTVMMADMTVAYALFRETFTSRVTLDRPALAILVEYVDGPFRFLDNRWRFRPLGENRSEVDFYIEWELRSRTLGLVVGAVFDRAFRRFTESFEARADKVYGAGALAPAQS